ncbi:MAG: hypothetical protein JO301_04490 [Chitinophagaceae bacterium]|nr:hypothetical protein [Chitinophagaceae bacterium]
MNPRCRFAIFLLFLGLSFTTSGQQHSIDTSLKKHFEPFINYPAARISGKEAMIVLVKFAAGRAGDTAWVLNDCPEDFKSAVTSALDTFFARNLSRKLLKTSFIQPVVFLPLDAKAQIGSNIGFGKAMIDYNSVEALFKPFGNEKLLIRGPIFRKGMTAEVTTDYLHKSN